METMTFRRNLTGGRVCQDHVDKDMLSQRCRVKKQCKQQARTLGDRTGRHAGVAGKRTCKKK